MQKILFVTDAATINIATLEFAVYVAQCNHAKIKGLFLEDLKYPSRPEVKQLYGSVYVEEITSATEQTEEQKREIADTIAFFRRYCVENDVACIIHKDTGTPVHEVIQESRYADMIIIDAATSFSYSKDTVPSKFVKDILAKAECPVIVAPENFNGLKEVVFCFDNSRSSLYAIKQFTYLFPAFSAKNITLLHISEEGEDIIGKEETLEWLNIHYPSVSIKLLSGDPKTELFKTYFGQTDKLLVMGAFGGSTFNNFFRGSTADLVLKAVDTPLFIAHQ